MTSPYRAKHSTPESTSSDVRYAPSLEAALPGNVLFLDRQGHVREPSFIEKHRHEIALVFSPLVGAACFFLAWFASSYASSGTIEACLVVLGSLYLFVFAVLLVNRRVTRAVILVARNQTAEAVAIADRQLAHPILGAAYVTSAYLIKGYCADREGKYAEAIEHYRRVRYAPVPKSHRAVGRASFIHERALFAEVVALANVGKGDEARKLLATAPPPVGEYLELLADIASLSVAFALDDGGVVDHAKRAARRWQNLSMSWTVVGLAGWCLLKAGDEEGRRLIELELGKPHSVPLGISAPRFEAWLRSAGFSPT